MCSGAGRSVGQKEKQVCDKLFSLLSQRSGLRRSTWGPIVKAGYVYLVANKPRGRTYLGVTSNLPQRAYQHRNGLIDGYSKVRGCHLLVWFEKFDDLQEARACELRMKKWNRAWKLRVIEERNPEWRDLFDGLMR